MHYGLAVGLHRDRKTNETLLTATYLGGETKTSITALEAKQTPVHLQRESIQAALARTLHTIELQCGASLSVVCGYDAGLIRDSKATEGETQAALQYLKQQTSTYLSGHYPNQPKNIHETAYYPPTTSGSFIDESEEEAKEAEERMRALKEVDAQKIETWMEQASNGDTDALEKLEDRLDSQLVTLQAACHKSYDRFLRLRHELFSTLWIQHDNFRERLFAALQTCFPTTHNLCIKGDGDTQAPPFSDVTATHIGDEIDARNNSQPGPVICTVPDDFEIVYVNAA